MFNVKLMTTNMMKKLRINVLVSAGPSGRFCWFSATVSALAGGAFVMTLLTQGTVPCVATSGLSLIPVILAAGTLPLLLFQGVCPVRFSYSLRIALESCALNGGSPNGFPLGLVWAGGIPPLSLLPLPPLPHSGYLGSMAAGNLCRRVGTLHYRIVDWSIDQSFGVDNM